MNSRRQFIKANGILGLGLMGGFSGFAVAAASQRQQLGFGALAYKKGNILSLPGGFTAKVISRAGDVMDDGLLTPAMAYGMGAFASGQDNVILVRNHRIPPGSDSAGAFGKNNINLRRMEKGRVYDDSVGDIACLGGVTTLVYDEKKQAPVQEFLNMTGTINNGCGGATKWNTWVSCENSSLRKGDLDKQNEDGVLQQDHGYAFEVSASTAMGQTKEPVPIRSMGRFKRNALLFHPSAPVAYQTEDEINGVMYRYLLPEEGKLSEGGKLQAMVIKNWPSADTRNWECLKSPKFPMHQQFDVEWIDLDDPQSPNDDLRMRAWKSGAARFSSAAGIWRHKDQIFIAGSSGGKRGGGQVFRYIPSVDEGRPKEKGAKIELIFEPNDLSVLQNGYGLIVSPWGDILLSERGQDARITGLTPKGQTYPLAQNIAYRGSEIGGLVFSPAGKTLFVSIPHPGVTLAITGPWIK